MAGDLEIDLREVLTPAAAEVQRNLVEGLLATGKGVRSGELVRELGNRSNAEIEPLSFAVSLPGDVLIRWRAFVAGRTGKGLNKQPARPIEGIDDALLRDLGQRIAGSTRDQLVCFVNEQKARA